MFPNGESQRVLRSASLLVDSHGGSGSSEWKGLDGILEGCCCFVNSADEAEVHEEMFEKMNCERGRKENVRALAFQRPTRKSGRVSSKFGSLVPSTSAGLFWDLLFRSVGCYEDVYVDFFS